MRIWFIDTVRGQIEGGLYEKMCLYKLSEVCTTPIDHLNADVCAWVSGIII